MKKRLIVLIVIFCSLYTNIAYAESTPQSILDARSSVVPIEIYTNDDELFGFGSGFAIGIKGQPVEYIVTNHHVGGLADEYRVVYSGDYVKNDTTLVFTLPELDLCVLKLNAPLHGISPLLLSASEPYSLTGERVYALGFPAAANNLFTKGKTTASDVTITDGIISAVRSIHYVLGGRSATVLQMNVAISGGNSGGPLLDENGFVLGVNTFSSREDTNMNGAIAIHELLAALDQKGIAYQKGPVDVPLSWWIMIGAVVIVIIALLSVFLLLKHKRKDKLSNKKKGSDRSGQRISLEDYLSASAAMSLDRAIYLLLAVFHKVRAQEQQGCCPLCIYPQNIDVLSKYGRALLERSEKKQTDGYCAPEQYTGDGQIGSWTDVYQLGALLYHTLVGRPLPGIMARYDDDGIVQKNIDALPIIEEKKAAIKKAISLKASGRFADTSELMIALDIAHMPAAPAGQMPIASDMAQGPVALDTTYTPVVPDMIYGPSASYVAQAPIAVHMEHMARAPVAAQGSSTIDVAQASSPAIQPANEAIYAGVKTRKAKWKLTVQKKRILVIATCFLMLMAAAGTYWGVNVYNRNHSIELLSQYNYKEAYSILKGMPGFIADDIDELSVFAEAGIAYDNGEYAHAQAKFETLGNFFFAPEMVIKCSEKQEEQAIEMLLADARALIKGGESNDAEALFDAYKYGPDLEGDYVIPEEKIDEIDYARALIYYEYDYFDTAIDILAKLGDYSNAKEVLIDVVLEKAADLAERKDVVAAYKSLQDYEKDAAAKQAMDALIPGIYELGIACYNGNNPYDAIECFEISNHYGKSQDYLKILTTNDVFALLPHLGTAIVDERVYNEPMISRFLEGEWRWGNLIFRMNTKKDGSYYVEHNLYRIGSDRYWTIQNGIYYSYKTASSVSDSGRPRFKISIISRNVIEIHMYESDKTYRLTRR